jgi:hypothetical protein
MNNFMDGRTGDFELFGKPSRSHLLHSVQVANLSDERHVHFHWPAALGDRIMSIIRVIAKKKMHGIYARRIIAMMQNLASRRNLAILERPRNTMSENGLAINPDYPIGACVLCALPQPTNPSLLHHTPKANLHWFSWRSFRYPIARMAAKARLSTSTLKLMEEGSFALFTGELRKHRSLL